MTSCLTSTLDYINHSFLSCTSPMIFMSMDWCLVQLDFWHTTLAMIERIPFWQNAPIVMMLRVCVCCKILSLPHEVSSHWWVTNSTNNHRLWQKSKLDDWHNQNPSIVVHEKANQTAADMKHLLRPPENFLYADGQQCQEARKHVMLPYVLAWGNITCFLTPFI